MWALLFKGDQAEINLGAAPEGVRPTALYEIQKTGNGQAATRAISDFVRKGWCSGYAEATSKFKVSEAATNLLSISKDYTTMGRKCGKRSWCSLERRRD